MYTNEENTVAISLSPKLLTEVGERHVLKIYPRGGVNLVLNPSIKTKYSFDYLKQAINFIDKNVDGVKWVELGFEENYPVKISFEDDEDEERTADIYIAPRIEIPEERNQKIPVKTQKLFESKDLEL